jgi:hypothetical protein
MGLSAARSGFSSMNTIARMAGARSPQLSLPTWDPHLVAPTADDAPRRVVPFEACQPTECKSIVMRSLADT